MVDLVIRYSNASNNPKKQWALQLRDHNLAETDYSTLCYVDLDTARLIIDAGAPYWLYGPPTIEEIERLERKRRIKELLDELEELEREEENNG